MIRLKLWCSLDRASWGERLGCELEVAVDVGVGFAAKGPCAKLPLVPLESYSDGSRVSDIVVVVSGRRKSLVSVGFAKVFF